MARSFDVFIGDNDGFGAAGFKQFKTVKLKYEKNW